MGYYKHNDWDNYTFVDIMEFYTYALNRMHIERMQIATIMGNKDKNGKTIKIEDIYV